MALLGMEKINMYSRMIDEAFTPLTDRIFDNHTLLKEKAHDFALKQLKINKLYEEQDRLKGELKDIRLILEPFETRKYIDGDWTTPIDTIIDKYMEKHKDKTEELINKARRKLKDRVKLSGISTDVASVFEDLPKMIKDLSKICKL